MAIKNFYKSKMVKQGGGHTLIETMIASSLLLLVMGCVILALTTAMQHWRRIDEQTQLENSLIYTCESLIRDGSETSFKALAWGDSDPERPSLTFLSPRDLDGQLIYNPVNASQLLFASVISYRIMDKDREFRRYLDALSEPSDKPFNPVSAITPPYSPDFYNDPSRSYKILSKGIVGFDVTPIAFKADGSERSDITFSKAKLIRIQIRLERKFKKAYALSFQTDISPNN